MSTSNTENSHNDSTTHLKSRIEQSVALLCETQDASATLNGPARRSSLPIHIDAAYLQKGALVDAAKALSALWKVPTRVKLPNRTLQYSR